MVLSANDGSAVAGASIKMSFPGEDLAPAPTVVTARDGRFDVEPYYQWHLYSIMGESWPIHGSIEVSAPGYVPYKQELRWPQTKPRTQDLGTIRLARAQ